ncbi:MerR family transcriptional regulator [Hathewaya massiliensis]|uniref:MerR family transcriptional regulator n=1 Tax=Hathewaya massiliensis TaxID=1964382 RepID=UPI0011576C1B|nr:MerR family transcriptional regulator [Hathewaya massiliensis]
MDKYLTTGEFSNKAGVTIRTLRYYDKINLLKPSNYNENGHRLYSMQDFIKLQKILTLKFIGLSLEDISKIMLFDGQNEDLKNSLSLQKKIIENKISHFNTIVKAIDEVLKNISHTDTPKWDEIIGIIDIVNKDNKWIEQYKNATNLRSRIFIHENYSKNKKGWMPWFFDEVLSLNLNGEVKILELGCGDASLWVKNIDRIPSNFKITLSDFSEGMLKDAQDNLKDYTDKFEFKLINAENIPYPSEEFHIVIGNHLLYHLSYIDKALEHIKRVLKPGGYFFSSTVGENHMKELKVLIDNFNSNELTSDSLKNTRSFTLKNGENILKNYFKDVIMKRYEDALIIDNALPLIHYIFSVPDNVHDNFNEKLYKKLVTYIEDIINKAGKIVITKDTGYFRCIK